MQLEKNRTDRHPWMGFFWLQRFCLPRPQRSGWFQGKLCDSNLAPAMKNEGKMIMTAYSPPLNMSIPPLRWPWISGGCPILYSVSYYNPKIPTNNLIFGVSYITILWFLRTILFLRCLLLKPYWLLPTVWFFSVSYITILKIPTENLIFAMFHVTILSFIPKIRFKIPYNNVIFALSYISILWFLPKSSTVFYVMSVDLTWVGYIWKYLLL